LVDQRRKQALRTVCCFMDIRKAYDTVWRDVEVGGGGGIGKDDDFRVGMRVQYW